MNEKNEKRRGRKVNFEARVPKVYAKLKPLWERLDVGEGSHDAIEDARTRLRHAAVKYGETAALVRSALTVGRDLEHRAAECQRAKDALDAVAMELAAICEFNLARVETQAQLDAAERARKPRRGRKPARKPPAAKTVKKTRKPRAKKPAPKLDHTLLPLPAKKTRAKKTAKKSKRASK